MRSHRLSCALIEFEPARIFRIDESLHSFHKQIMLTLAYSLSSFDRMILAFTCHMTFIPGQPQALAVCFRDAFFLCFKTSPFASYENEFGLNENELLSKTHFHMKGFASGLVLKEVLRLSVE